MRLIPTLILLFAGVCPAQSYGGSTTISKTKGTATFTVAASDAPVSVRRVADYRCTGANDDVELNAARVAAGVGGLVTLSEGTFVLNAGFAGGNKVRVQGKGEATILQRHDSSTDNYIVGFAGVTDFWLSDCLLDGNSDDDELVYGIIFSQASTGARVENVTVKNCTFAGSIGIWNNSTGAGPTDCIISYCTIDNIAGKGMHLNDMGDSYILYNKISNCTDGIFENVTSATNNIYLLNEFAGNSGTDLTIDATSYDFSASEIGGGATTEAGLESDLTDVTNVFTNNDGALDDDDITDDAVGSLNNVDATTGLATNKVLKYNGSNWVVADYDEDLSFSIATFTDNLSGSFLLGSGEWKASGTITFDMTYNNGPPATASVAIAGDFDGGSGSGWTADTLTVTTPFTTQVTGEGTNYPDDSGDTITFTLTANADTYPEPALTFYNYFIYDEFAGNSSFNDTNLDSIASDGTQVVTSDHTRTFTQTIGASNYMVFAHRSAGTTVAQVRCGTGSNQITAAFNKNDATAVTPLKETVSHSNAATNAKTENFYVYASKEQNLDAHSNSFTTLTSGTAQNYVEWGKSAINTGWSSAQIVAFASQYAENDYTQTSRYTGINPGADDYIVHAFPSRLLGPVIPAGTDYETDGGGTGWVFDGVTCAVAAAETIAVTNAAGFQENYEVYCSVGKDCGSGSGTLKTYTDRTAINFVYFGSDAGNPISEAQIEGMDTLASGDGFSSGKLISNTRARSVTFGPAGAGEYVWYCYPKRLGTVTVTIDGIPGGFQAPVTVSVTNMNGWTEDYYCYRSDYTDNVSKTYVWSNS